VATRDQGPTGAQALRALAHPTRWRLLDVLEAESSATATRCAQLIGESVASCAYHLGILGKYGYAEQAPPSQGRERPWRLVSYRQDLRPQGLDVEGQLAAEAATEAFLDHEINRFKTRLREAETQPPQWRPWFQGRSVTLTEAEYARIKQRVEEVVEQELGQYADRGTAVARPVGSRLVRLFVAASARPHGGGGDGD